MRPGYPIRDLSPDSAAPFKVPNGAKPRPILVNDSAKSRKFTTRLAEGVRKNLKAERTVILKRHPFASRVKLELTQQRAILSLVPLSIKAPKRRGHNGMTHLSLGESFDNAFPTGFSPLLLRVQQSPVSKSGAATSHDGLRVPYLPKRRRDRRQRLGISE